MAIEIKNLTKRYPSVTAVDDLSLTIEEGELFALLGVNGAGKTTTIKMLCALSKPTSGDALVGGRSVVNEGGRVKEIIGVSPQETAVAPNLTARENLRLLCGVYAMDKATEEARIAELSNAFGLTEIMDRRAGKLSGGWQRRLSIAMALVGHPKILFLDEPTLGLDVLARNDLWDILRRLKEEMTIVLTTHYMEEAEALSDRIGIMKGGKLIALGTADSLKERAGTEKFEEAFVAIVRGREI